MRIRIAALAFACALAAGGWTGARAPLALRAASPRPTTPAQAFLAEGRRLFDDTQRLMPHNVGARMSCAACHLSDGTTAHGLSLRGSYTRFPRWNERARRFIAVQDRIAECFLYSMNGKPPAYDSRQMIALTAFIASLSKGVPLGSGVAGQRLIPVPATAPPNIMAGAKVYAQRCALCHAQNGAGTAAAPPLWGSGSFTTGAGMYRHDTLSAFVRYNMPFGSPPNTLTAKAAVDVAAYIMRQPRPRFRGHAPVIFAPEPAEFF